MGMSKRKEFCILQDFCEKDQWSAHEVFCEKDKSVSQEPMCTSLKTKKKYLQQLKHT